MSTSINILLSNFGNIILLLSIDMVMKICIFISIKQMSLRQVISQMTDYIES